MDTIRRLIVRMAPENHEWGDTRIRGARGRRGLGRPRVMDTIRRLIVRMAPENREWGDTRIRGARGNLGHQVARGPLANVRKERGLDPAPERKKRTTWREFLAAHGDVLAAADCFTVKVWTPRGLTRFTVLVLSHLASRRVQIAGISAEPDGPGVTQLMRNAPDAEDGFLRHIRFLLHDHDPLFRPAVRDTLPPADVTPIRLHARAPNLNAYTERFGRTIKDSCLERMVLTREGSLRWSSCNNAARRRYARRWKCSPTCWRGQRGTRPVTAASRRTTETAALRPRASRQRAAAATR